MKKIKFRVWFANDNYEPECVTVSAINQNDALILAQAERVKKGLDYTLQSIKPIRLKHN